MNLTKYQFNKLLKLYIKKANQRLCHYNLKVKLIKYPFVKKEKYYLGMYVPKRTHNFRVIPISLNQKGIKKYYKSECNTFKEAVRITIYHEIAHGIINYLDYNYSLDREESLADGFAWDWEINNLSMNQLFQRLKKHVSKNKK